MKNDTFLTLMNEVLASTITLEAKLFSKENFVGGGIRLEKNNQS